MIEEFVTNVSEFHFLIESQIFTIKLNGNGINKRKFVSRMKDFIATS